MELFTLPARLARSYIYILLQLIHAVLIMRDAPTMHIRASGTHHS